MTPAQSATVEEQREVILRAIDEAYLADRLSDAGRAVSVRMVMAEAYLDAVLVMMPEGMCAEGALCGCQPSYMEVHATGVFEPVGVGRAATPALALLAALEQISQTGDTQTGLASTDERHD